MQGSQRTTTLVAITFLGFALGQGQARADYLADLIAGNGSVQVGSLVFDQFSYLSTGQMPSASNVIVTPTFDASGNPGIRFTGGFTDASDSPGAVQQSSDAVLGYRVTAVGAPLGAVQLFGNPQILGSSDGIMSVTETLQTGTGTQPVQLEIHDTVANGVNSQQLQDGATLSPVQSIEIVSKDIFAFNLGGVPTASFVDQTFATAIPEPTALILTGLGITVLAGYGWRRRAAARVETQG